MSMHPRPSDMNTQHFPTCCCGQTSGPSVYRVTTRASLASSTSDPGSQKVRYGGRGGAGSRPRTIAPPPIPKRDKVASDSLPQSQSSNFKTKWLSRAASSDALNTPSLISDTPTSSLAGRRGTTNIPSPLILRNPSESVPDLNTPPLSAMSTTTTSTATYSEDALSPRSPYFYFDEAFDSSQSELPVHSPTSPGTMSRSLRRFASRTQGFFSKDPSVKAPPPTPMSPTHVTPVFSPLTSPSETSVATSEWYDPPESPTYDPENSHPAPLPAPIVVELPLGGRTRTRSPSVATVKPRARKQKGDRKQREPRPHGEWNRDDLGEVIAALRMLK
ncbi:hypothetical protein B0H19DRAFT_1258896 [Mycena capillaripes]|nr:hypothetical protein B0H19DRAFT_1258896 [Mycena capillaripes]